MASHGKRCQQSPFRGSPYCWHHLQSRKVPAPSRPPRANVIPFPQESELPSVDRMAIAVRLAHGLSADELAQILRFIEDRRDGTLVVIRDGARTDIQTYRRGEESGRRRASSDG